jgi:ribonuclease HI
LVVSRPKRALEMTTEAKSVTIYTDGACLGNPGPGGYAVVLLHGKHRKELSGGYRLTTSNRMEIMAAIAGLQALKHRCTVKLHTDSEYLQKSISLGWAHRWRAKNWKKGDGKRLNWDLWERLLDLCAQHDVEFIWLRGHAGDTENERCDFLSVQAAERKDLAADTAYEEPASRPQQPAPPSLFDLGTSNEA